MKKSETDTSQLHKSIISRIIRDFKYQELWTLRVNPPLYINEPLSSFLRIWTWSYLERLRTNYVRDLEQIFARSKFIRKVQSWITWKYILNKIENMFQIPNTQNADSAFEGIEGNDSEMRRQSMIEFQKTIHHTEIDVYEMFERHRGWSFFLKINYLSVSKFQIYCSKTIWFNRIGKDRS